MLYVSHISSSTYSYELSKSDIDDKNTEIVNRIKDIFYENKKRYCVRRIYHQLINEGFKINHKKVQRIMNKYGLFAKKYKKKYRSYQGRVGVVADNIILRDFKANKPNQKWTTDVSQFSFRWGNCFLSPIMDMFNNEIVSFDLSTKADYQQIERMLKKVNIGEKDYTGLILHSDQGWQYQNPRYVDSLLKSGIKQSMSRKGNCYDNSIMESFFGLMKNEMFYGHEDEIGSFDIFKTIVNEYIDYYNNKRIKCKTNWMSPVAYRLSVQNT